MDSNESAFLRNSRDLLSEAEDLRDGEVSCADVESREQLEAEVRGIHEEHAKSLFAFARMLAGDAETAEEALQEAYHRYLVYRTQGRKILNSRAWLLRVMHNLIIDWKKAQARRTELHADLPAPEAQRDDQTASLGELLEKTKGVLSSREQQVLDLRLKGMRYIDVAEYLGIGEGSVSSHLSRAFRKLRRLRRNHEK